MGERIRLARQHKLNIEQGALAAKIGVSAMAVSKWERDENAMEPHHLQKLAEETGLRAEWFINGKNLSERGLALLLLANMVSHDDQDFFDDLEYLLNRHFERYRRRKSE
jgi:transcriptional regulator with XRE-family HTH domain